MEIVTKYITDMNRAAYNPRIDLQPGDEEYESIRHSLEKFSLVQPIVWNKRTNTVVSGHQRLTVLERMGVQTVDVSVVDMDAVKEKELNIALNKIEGTWDDRKLSAVLVELGENAGETGFTMPEINALRGELKSYFDDETVEEQRRLDTMEEKAFLLTLTFFKSDEKVLKSFVKKNGEEAIVETIIQKIEGFMA